MALQPDRRGIGQLNHLLLASLLLHLGLILIVGLLGRRDSVATSQSSLVMVDLEQAVPTRADRSARPAPSAAPVPAALQRPGAPAGQQAAGAPNSAPGAAGSLTPVKAAGFAADPTPVGAGVKTGQSRPMVGARGPVSSPPVEIGAIASQAHAGAPERAAGALQAAGGSASGPGGAGPNSGALAGRSDGPFRPDPRGGYSGPGQGTALQRRSLYQAQLKSLVEAHKEYPVAARKMGREGSCQRRFVLGRDGSLRRVESLSSCGHPFLDGAATRAITGVGTFPALPEEFGGSEESFTITMTFTLASR
jgi:TonB family protein